MKRGDLVAVPASWWSGWAFDDDGLVLESGYSYCGEALNALDYAVDKFGKPERVLAVGYPGDYGGDSAAGANIWGEANGVVVAAVKTAPNAAAGNQDAVVSAIKRQSPDVVLLATGPAEMAEIVGKAVAGGFKGEFIGSVPTFNPAVLKSQASGDVLLRVVLVWQPHCNERAARDAYPWPAVAAHKGSRAGDGVSFSPNGLNDRPVALDWTQGLPPPSFAILGPTLARGSRWVCGGSSRRSVGGVAVQVLVGGHFSGG
jgi:hypothetical protein